MKRYSALFIALAAAFVLLGAGWGQMQPSAQVEAGTSPIPTWTRPAPVPLTPTPVPMATREPVGAYIELRLIPPDPALWTQVEWQDGLGEWHRVDGWQGPIDGARQGVGWKRWWLAADLFGRGPFRWAVLNEREGEVIASSDPFTLPTGSNLVLVIPVSLPSP